MFGLSRTWSTRYVRHAFLETIGADDQRDLTRKAGEVHRGLAGGVGPADDVHVLAGDVLGFGERGPVVTPRPVSFFDARRLQPAVVDAGGDDDAVGARACRRPARRTRRARTARLETARVLDGDDFGAEASGLCRRRDAPVLSR